MESPSSQSLGSSRGTIAQKRAKIGLMETLMLEPAIPFEKEK